MYDIPMKTFKQILTEHGFTLKEAAARGIPYDTLAKHARGARRVGLAAAARYERLLGIPRSELRPDVWDMDMYPPRRGAHDMQETACPAQGQDGACCGGCGQERGTDGSAADFPSPQIPLRHAKDVLSESMPKQVQ